MDALAVGLICNYLDQQPQPLQLLATHDDGQLYAAAVDGLALSPWGVRADPGRDMVTDQHRLDPASQDFAPRFGSA